MEAHVAVWALGLGECGLGTKTALEWPKLSIEKTWIKKCVVRIGVGYIWSCESGAGKED